MPPTRHLRTAGLIAAVALLSAFLVPTGASATTPGHNGRIAFKSYLDADRTTGAIASVRPDGTHRHQLTFPAPGTVDDQPDVSPNGRLVAFRRCVPDTVCAIYIVHSDGTRLRRLSAPCDASGPDLETKCADESEVAFLPDGRHVVFTRSTGLVRELSDGEGWIQHSDIVIRALSAGTPTSCCVVARSQVTTTSWSSPPTATASPSCGATPRWPRPREASPSSSCAAMAAACAG